MSFDPFAQVDLTIEYVDSVAGSRKTWTAVDQALLSAKRRDTRTIFAMPTLALVQEWIKYAREKEPLVPSYEITTKTKSEQGPSVTARILKHIASRKAGHLLFITHEGFHRVGTWPPEAAGFELYIDEVLEVILSRKPFKLRDNHWILSRFIATFPMPTTIAERNAIPDKFTDDDQQQLENSQKVMDLQEYKRLREKRKRWDDWVKQQQEKPKTPQTYYTLIPKPTPTKDPFYWLRRHDTAKQSDDIYEYLDPIAKWLLQGNALFTDIAAWDKTVVNTRDPNTYRDRSRGLITITGFRRPDVLKAFGRVTIMSALLKYTMLYDVWQTLGVTFVPSPTIKLAQQKTDLGKRKLSIYWLTDEGWSKHTRDRSGGIENILHLIKNSGVIKDQPVCVFVNKDDGSEINPTKVTKIFPKGIVMPHNVKGRNFWENRHQMIHCAAFNSYTSDIRWMESVLGIDSDRQRIGRTGQEVYQSLMRLSLRAPKSRSDITVVVMDKDVAEWVAEWFTGAVEVTQIDASGVIRKKEKRGPKPSGKALSSTERTRRQRERERME